MKEKMEWENYSDKCWGTFGVRYYQIHRLGKMKDGGTQHWFSKPLLRDEVKGLCRLWKDKNHKPTIYEVDEMEVIVERNTNNLTQKNKCKLIEVTVSTYKHPS